LGLAPSTPADKVKLFRQLFRGRPDLYPTRFVSKTTGKAGYAPACSNKFVVRRRVGPERPVFRAVRSLHADPDEVVEVAIGQPLDVEGHRRDVHGQFR
jgi:hypothetical protein